MMIRIDPLSTSRTCVGCGVVDETQLLRTRYRCWCGLNIHRDRNAAIDIRKRGLVALEAARRFAKLDVANYDVRAPETQSRS